MPAPFQFFGQLTLVEEQFAVQSTKRHEKPEFSTLELSPPESVSTAVYSGLAE
jgi:hypothetical protein